jgi:hypothetical protein
MGDITVEADILYLQLTAQSTWEQISGQLVSVSGFRIWTRNANLYSNIPEEDRSCNHAVA